MALALTLALQAAALHGSAPMPIAFDLAKYRPADPGRGCEPGDGSEIVVCGRRPGRGSYPLEQMARIFEEKPLVAEASLGGGATGSVYLESAAMPNGEISKRLMVGVKLGF